MQIYVNRGLDRKKPNLCFLLKKKALAWQFDIAHLTRLNLALISLFLGLLLKINNKKFVSPHVGNWRFEFKREDGEKKGLASWCKWAQNRVNKGQNRV